MLTETDYYIAYPTSYDINNINCSQLSMEIYFTNDTGIRELYYTFPGSSFKLNKNYNECQLIGNLSGIDLDSLKDKPALIDNKDQKYDELRFMLRFRGIPN